MLYLFYIRVLDLKLNEVNLFSDVLAKFWHLLLLLLRHALVESADI